jgi:hypothetical protein
LFKKNFILTLPLFYRNHGDHKFLNEEFLKVWEEVPNVLSNISFEMQNGLATLEIDWVKKYIPRVKEKLINFYTIEDYYNGKIPEGYIIEENEEFIDINCQFSIENFERKVDLEGENRILSYYLENIFLQIFMAINLSTPGAFSCFSYELMAKKKLEIYSFSSSEFESAWIESINTAWPTIERLNLSETWEWIKGLNLGHRQIAENSIERALFSILTNCKDNFVNPNQLIWNSLALEALYDTPREKIAKILLDRISQYLEIPEKDNKKIKKRIRDFYDIRSKFVHGELDVLHPLYNNVLDPRIFDYDEIMINNAEFSFCMVISTLQKMIKSNRKTLKF